MEKHRLIMHKVVAADDVVVDVADDDDDDCAFDGVTRSLMSSLESRVRFWSFFFFCVFSEILLLT